ncbi:NAD(P)-binding protein [Schizophyllum commune Loenen D]|nr:NAD(P)-binding protein [Schizophyllum commune Loenen D]
MLGLARRSTPFARSTLRVTRAGRMGVREYSVAQPRSIADAFKVDAQKESLEGKVILVTGGTSGASGLGHGIVKHFTNLGARVVLADLNYAAAEQIAQETGATAYAADVSDWSSTYSVFERTWEKYGALHHVFTMAGAVEPKNVFDDTFDSEGRLEAPKYDVINSHVIGAFNTVKAALHYFRRQQNGEVTDAPTDGRSITLCGSYYSYFTDTGVYQYCTSKHGIVGLMRGLSQYTPSIGVRTNMLAPWFVATPFVLNMAKAYPENWAHIPMTPTSQIGLVAGEMATNANRNGTSIFTYDDKYIDDVNSAFTNPEILEAAFGKELMTLRADSFRDGMQKAGEE